MNWRLARKIISLRNGLKMHKACDADSQIKLKTDKWKMFVSQTLTVFISFIYHDILWGGPSMKNFPKLKANKPTISFSLLLLQVFSELKHFPSLTLPSSFPPLALPSSLPPSLLSSSLSSSLLFLPSSLPLRYILKYICLGQLI